MRAMGRIDFGSRIHRLSHSELRRAPIPSKVGASILSSGTPVAFDGRAWHLAQRCSRNNSRPRCSDCACSSRGELSHASVLSGMGAVNFPFSDQPSRRIASPFPGLVNVALNLLVPFLSCTDLLIGEVAPFSPLAS